MDSQRIPTVLLIDDNHELLESFGYHLETFEGFHIVTADNGAMGLEQFFIVHPQCVIIDVRMPEIDGYQLARVLRGDPLSANVPLIMLSALQSPKDMLIGMLSGVDRYLQKPVKPSELANVIREVLAISVTARHQRLIDLNEEES